MKSWELGNLFAWLLEKNKKTKRRENKNMNNKTKYDNNGIYATEDIIELFWGLLKEGYTGLGFGLILDLIEDRLEDTRELKQDKDVNK